MSRPIFAVTTDLHLLAKIKNMAEAQNTLLLQVTDSPRIHSLVAEKRPTALFLDLEAPFVDPLGT
ncbi:MAG: hypothetical protein Q7S00_01510, partial [bacterium]|nr:hypothetical protein [bacterium]